MNYFKTSGEYERKGQLDKALFTLISGKRLVHLARLRNVMNDNIQRIVDKSSRVAHGYFCEAEPLYEGAVNPRSYQSIKCESSEILRPVISLTTISSRIGRVEQTIKTILKQTLKPHSINLYV